MAASFKVEGGLTGAQACFQLHLSVPRQGSDLRHFDLTFELVCGTENLRDDLDVAARCCLVRAFPLGCSLKPGTLYSHYLQRGKFEETHKSTSSAENKTTAGAEMDVEAKASSWVPRFDIMARLSAKKDYTKKKEDVGNSISSYDIALIESAPHNSWKVGDVSQGDRRKADSLLSGTYFTEERNPSDQSPLPAAFVEATDGVEAVKVGLGVLVRPGDLCVIKRRGRKKSEFFDYDEFAAKDENVRGRIAGWCVFKKMKNARRRKELDGVFSDIQSGQLLVTAVMLSGAETSGGPSDAVQ